MAASLDLEEGTEACRWVRGEGTVGMAFRSVLVGGRALGAFPDLELARTSLSVLELCMRSDFRGYSHAYRHWVRVGMVEVSIQDDLLWSVSTRCNAASP